MASPLAHMLSTRVLPQVLLQVLLLHASIDATERFYRPAEFLSDHENSLKAFAKEFHPPYALRKKEEANVEAAKKENVVLVDKRAVSYGSLVNVKDAKKLEKVAVGPAGVWSLDDSGAVFYRSGTIGNWETQGIAWENLILQTKSERLRARNLTEISVGKDSLWVTDVAGNVFARKGLTPFNAYGSPWTNIGGSLKQVAVSAVDDTVYGVAANGSVFKREGISRKMPFGNHWEIIQGYLKQISVGPSGVWGVNFEDEVAMLYNDNYYHTWRDVKGLKVKKVAVGNGIVWAQDLNNFLYYRVGLTPKEPIGTSWSRYTTTRTLDFGVDGIDNQLWQIQTNHKVYFLKNVQQTSEGTGWSNVKDSSGKVMPREIAIGPDGVWIVDLNGEVYHRQGTAFFWEAPGHLWVKVEGINDVKAISVGKSSVWVTKNDGTLHWREGINRRDIVGVEWKQIAPPTGHRMAQVSVRSDDLELWGTDFEGNIFYRKGLTKKNAEGNGWKQIPGTLTKVSVGLDAVWGINADGEVFYFFDGGRAFDGGNWMQYWLQVAWGSEKVKDIAVGHEAVWVVHTNRNAYFRKGITKKNAIGLSWLGIGATFDKVAVNSNDNQIWTLLLANAKTTTVYRRKGLFWKEPFDVVSGSGDLELGREKCPKPCQDGVKMDILFVVDGSLSIGKSNFQETKQILKDFIKLFEIGPNSTRIGLIQFSAESVEEFPMERFASKEALLNAVDRVEYQEGRFTHLGTALKCAKESLETSRNEATTAAATTEAATTAAAATEAVTTEAAPTAAATVVPLSLDLMETSGKTPQIVIVITDGVVQDRIRSPAHDLIEEGAVVYAVGVGNDVRPDQLSIITGGVKARRFMIEEFYKLSRTILSLSRSICNVGRSFMARNG